ncbi:MAG: metallophosphoesterase family protein [Gemmataceae bacterium]
MSSTSGLAAAMAAGPHLFGRETPAADQRPFSSDMLFLTWMRDPTTTMTVTWIGNEKDAPDPTVRYRKHGGKASTPWTKGPKTTIKAFPVIETAQLRAEALKAAIASKNKAEIEKASIPVSSEAPRYTGPVNFSVFQAELTGLTPGTEYEFMVGTASPTYRFRTMPAKATKSFHFISGGDCGVNSHVIANNRNAAAQDPMFALIGGDLGYDNGTSGHTATMFIRNYAQTMIDSEGRLIPLVACLGNHEVRGHYNKSFKEATFFAPLFGGLYSEKSYATLDFGDYLSLVLMDTGHCANIVGEQTTWLKKALQDRDGVPHLIPVNHVPCYPSYRSPESTDKNSSGTGQDQRKHWCPLFEKYGVDVVLEHHDHTFKRTRPITAGNIDEATGITYLGDGSWGRLRAPRSPESRSYLEEVSESYHLTLHRLEGEQRFHLAMGESGKILDIFRSTRKPRHRTPGVTTG